MYSFLPISLIICKIKNADTSYREKYNSTFKIIHLNNFRIFIRNISVSKNKILYLTHTIYFKLSFIRKYALYMNFFLMFKVPSTHSVVVLPPQSTAVDYSLREEPSRSRPRLAIDLSEWRDHRVLALRDSYYFPGVIRNVVHGEILIEFDGERKLMRYSDVLGARRYDVIGDASPSLGQVTTDMKVCIRCPTSSSHVDATKVFVKGIVSRVLTKPSRFVVKIPREDDQCDSYIVKRADLRLVQPPWADELEEGLEECDPTRENIGKKSFINKTIYFYFSKR